jgi:Tfp pilus assembly protein PilZ
MFEHRDIKPRINFLSSKSGTIKDLGASVISVKTFKRMSQVAGSFELRLLPKPHEGSSYATPNQLAYIYQNISPMDLISIGFQKENGRMLGITDSVSIQKVDVNNNVRREVVVRGRDFGKILIEDSTDMVQAAGENSANVIERIKEFLLKIGIVKTKQEASEHSLVNYFAFSNRAPNRIDSEGGEIGRIYVGATIDEAISYVLKSLTSLRIIFSFEGSNLSAGEILLRPKKIESRPNDFLGTDAYIYYKGSIINFIHQLIDCDFYEVWVDSIGKNAILIVRPKPFDHVGDKVTGIGGKMVEIQADDPFCWENAKTLITKEPYHTINDEDILTSAMGVADHEATSMYITTASKELSGSNKLSKHGLLHPLIDFYSVKRYGLRIKYTNSQLVRISKEDEKSGLVLDRIRGLRDRVFNWYRYNPFLVSGSIIVRGNDKYRIGDKIFLPDEITKHGKRGIMAYCIGVEDSYVFGRPYTTTLHLIRGEHAQILQAVKKGTDEYILRT